MQYEIFLDDKLILNGQVLGLSLIIGAIFIIFVAIFSYIIKKSRENSRMKYEFITIVAHKFRTPLTYIKWVCDALIPDETDSFKKKSLEDVKISNQKIIDLTSTLIEIADSESSGSATYVYEKLPLGELVRSISNKYKDMMHEKNLFFAFDCKNEKSKVRVDKSRLEFVLSTLLENACIYTPPGKNVSISITNTLFSNYISIEDSGIGITKQDLPHIFTKFFRGKNARLSDTEGFGVGLYLAKSIVKKFHGKIYVESPGEGLGSTFTIKLPRVR